MKRHANDAFHLRKSRSSMPFAWSSADSLKWFPFPPSGGSRTCHQRLVAEVGEERTPSRSHRHHPCVKRRRPYRYPRLNPAKTTHHPKEVALVEIALS